MIQGYSEWMEYQAAVLFGNVQGFEQNTLRRIGKRIDKYGRMNSADIKTINNIAAVNEDMDAIVKELAAMTSKNIREISDIYGEAIAYMHEQNRPLYDYRGKKFVPFEDNRELQALVRAFAKTTGGTMINLANTKMLGFTDKNGKFSHLRKAYTDVLDKAVMAVSTGTADFHTAMRDSIVELGGSGLRIQYDTITRRLDTVVRQNLLWGAKQASNEYYEMIGDELGCDGIEIDWHSNPRPSHEFMQGKQYALGGAKTVNGIKFESAGPALEALQDYGCLHYKMSIICGVSEPRYDADELARLNAQNSKTYEIGDKKMTGYEASQAMRRLETEVRRQKDIRELARASGDKVTVRNCNERIKAIKGKYTEISTITGIPEEPRRMSKPRVLKDDKLLTNSDSGDIINTGRKFSSRNMANGHRRSVLHELTESEIENLRTDIKAIGADENKFVFNGGDSTSYSDKHDVVFVRGDVLPDTNSIHPRDLMSARAALAHEYYGHRSHRGTKLKDGSWNDEFRASYLAAKNTPNLNDKDRRYLILDALERARESGVSIRYNNYIRRMLYE